MATAREVTFWRSVSAAVALVTAQLDHMDVDLSEIVAGLPPGDVIDALTAIAGGAMRGALGPSAAGDVVQRLGLIAASKAAGQPTAGRNTT